MFFFAERSSPRIRHTLLVLGAALVAACGGPQRAGNADCPGLSSDMPDAAYVDAMACELQRDPLDAAASCREATGFSSRMPPEALRMAAECTLAAGERTDGAWFAELLNRVAEDDARVVALAEAMPAAFDPTVHANTFSAGLAVQGERALGENLGAMSPAARAMVMEIGVGYGLTTLAGYATPYLRELGPDSEAVAAYASLVDPREDPIDEGERWALAASGTWTARDVMLCFEGERAGCEAWEGESPLTLLEYAEPEMESNPLPNAAIRMLEGGRLDPESLGAVTVWLATTNYPHRQDAVNDLMNALNDRSRPMATRMAIAENATGALCTFEEMESSAIGALYSNDPTLDDPGLPWNVYVDRCTVDWDASSLMRALAMGRWLAIHATVREALVQRLGVSTDGASCDEIVALAEQGWALHDRWGTAGAAYVVAAELEDGLCAEPLRASIEGLVRNNALHPESWLRSAIWLAERGDRRGCDAAGRARSWYDEDLRAGAGPESLALADRLDDLCR